MKYTEAVRQLLEQGDVRMFDIETLYKVEVFKRVELRAHGRREASTSLMEGVLKEMDEWIVKVCRGIGWKDDACEKARQECKQTALSAMRLATIVYARRKKDSLQSERK